MTEVLSQFATTSTSAESAVSPGASPVITSLVFLLCIMIIIFFIWGSRRVAKILEDKINQD